MKGLHCVCIFPGHCAPSWLTTGWSPVSKAKKCWWVKEVRDSCFKISFLPLASARDKYKDILSWTITMGCDSSWQQITSCDNICFPDTVPQRQTFVPKCLLSMPCFSFHTHPALRTALYHHPSSHLCIIWPIPHGQLIPVSVVSGSDLWFSLMEENCWTNNPCRTCQWGSFQAQGDVFCEGYKKMGECQLVGPWGQLEASL